jgi:hypothetical protein
VKTPIIPPRLAAKSSAVVYGCHEEIPESFASGVELAKNIGLAIGITVTQYAILILLISQASR